MRLFEDAPVREWDRPRAELTHPHGALRAATELAEDGSLSVPVRALTHHVLRACPSRGQAPLELARWIRSHLVYWMETPGREVLAGPISTVRANGGDCDDLTILHAAMCRSVGLVAYPTAMERRGAWHMVSWCPPEAPLELCVDTFYSGVHRVPRYIEPERGDVFLAYDLATDRFLTPGPSRHGPCSTC